MIRKLEDMCYDLNFNTNEAVNLIKNIDINQEFEGNKKYGSTAPTTLQVTAIENSNIKMLKLLLENGANPNQVYWDEESALWNLQYNSCESLEIDEIRLQMAQLLLEYGADPNMNPGNEPEDLFDWVWFALCEDGYSDSWVYLGRFFILLVAYGAKTQTWSPKIIKEFDKSNMQKYRFWFMKERIDNRCGVIVDDQGNDVAYI